MKMHFVTHHFTQKLGKLQKQALLMLQLHAHYSKNNTQKMHA